jgi:hypothetical protein
VLLAHAAAYVVRMATGDEVRFSTTATLLVRNEQMTVATLSQPEDVGSHVRYTDEGVVFNTEGWYEVLLRVDWDASNTDGTRFSHTRIPDQEPLHSEAINAAVLAQLSGGRQLLRGNSLFGPDRTTSLRLEVWQDSGQDLDVKYAELVIRELEVPWRENS